MATTILQQKGLSTFFYRRNPDGSVERRTERLVPDRFYGQRIISNGWSLYRRFVNPKAWSAACQTFATL